MASILDVTSSPSVFSELDLFTVPPTQVAVERSFTQEIRPLNALSDEGPYEFAVTGNHYFLDMTENLVYLKLKITMENGTNIPAHAEPEAAGNPVGNYVVPINLIGETFFRQVKMFINGKLAYDSGDNYPFLAYILTELNSTETAKRTYLTACGYDLECDEHVYDINADNKLIPRITLASSLDSHKNPGYVKKFARVRDSRFFETTAPLHIPFSHQEKYLLNGMDIRFELFRAKDSFVLMSGTGDEKFKIHVEDIKFNIRRVELTQQLCLALETALQKQPAKYPIRRLEMKTLAIEQGRLTTPENTIWSGQLPRRVVICLADSDAYFGNYRKNPFVFQHHDVEKVAIYVNGQCVPFGGPLNTQFRDRAHGANNLKPDLVMKAFTQLNKALVSGRAETSNGITLERFLINSCFFVFDLSQDNITDKSSWELLNAGTLSIYLKFHEKNAAAAAVAPANGLRVLILGEFDNLITINKNRDIEFDYAQ